MLDHYDDNKKEKDRHLAASVGGGGMKGNSTGSSGAVVIWLLDFFTIYFSNAAIGVNSPSLEALSVSNPNTLAIVRTL